MAPEGLLIPNLYRQSNEELSRAHNGVKFWNEFLARHLLVYVTYFMAMSLTATFISGWEWIKAFSTLVVAIAIGCYCFGVYNSTHQDKFFAYQHGCSNRKCRLKIGWRAIWKLTWKNAIMAIAMLIIGCGAACLVQ